MLYSSVGLLAIAVLLIVNHDIIFLTRGGRDIPALKAYRRFLFSVLIYYAADMLWGILDLTGFTIGLYIDTVIYFIIMAVAVLFWTQYVNAYLNNTDKLSAFLKWAGWVFLGFEAAVIIINFFAPILFWFDEAGAYHTGFARHVTLILQIVMFLLTSVSTLYAARNKDGDVISGRHRTIGLFGLIMILLIVLQIRYPLLPLYSVGYMLGTCLLHTFVIEDEKEDYRKELEAALEREKEQRAELGMARHMAYTDALTGVRSVHSYAEYEDQIDQRIASGEIREFAIAVFDINDLKVINDTMGHDTGDQYILSASRLICTQYKHSPVFRIGGDEFVAILEREDYNNRVELERTFNEIIDSNVREKKVVVSLGMSDFIPEHDNSFRRAFERADRQMYNRKAELKARKAAEPA